MKKLSRRLLRVLLGSRITTWVLFNLIRLYSMTYRLTVINEEQWWRIVDEDREPILIVSWHQHFFPAIRHFNNYVKYRPGLMISQSKDGDIVAGMAWASGWRPVRGSSSKGGKEAMHALIDVLRETGLAGHVVDGPRGPAGRIKAGALRIAHASGARVVSFTCEADRAWFMKGWDRFMIPKPFARVTMTYSDPVRFEPTTDPEAFEAQRLELEAAMREASGYDDEWPG